MELISDVTLALAHTQIIRQVEYIYYPSKKITPFLSYQIRDKITSRDIRFAEPFEWHVYKTCA